MWLRTAVACGCNLKAPRSVAACDPICAGDTRNSAGARWSEPPDGLALMRTLSAYRLPSCTEGCKLEDGPKDSLKQSESAMTNLCILVASNSKPARVEKKRLVPLLSGPS